MLLIYPPVAKPGEPPTGIAQLAGTLKAHGKQCVVLDANIEGFHYLIERTRTPEDTWSKRAERHLNKNRDALQDLSLFSNQDRYQRVVRDLNRVVEQSALQPELTLSLVNYQDQKNSPLRSSDLRAAAAAYEQNIYFPYFKQRLEQLFAQQPFTHVGFSLTYLSQANTTFAMIGFVRATFPDVTIIVGGGLVTSWLSQPGWKNPFADLVDHWITGRGEMPLLKLLNTEHTTASPPDYTDLPLADYLSPGTIIPYAASSGCYWNKCSFCPEVAEGNQYHHMPHNQIAADLHYLQQQHSPVLFHFLDNALSPALLKILIAQPTGIPWYGFARVAPYLADPEYCKQLRQSGCVMLKLGLESGNQQVLNTMRKGITLEMVSQTLRCLEQAGIATYVYLLFGTPSESLQEARETLKFTAQHHSAITFLNLAIFNMPIFGLDAQAVKVDDFYEGDLSLYCNFRHPRGWNRKDIRSFLDKEFKRHPDIAPIVHRDPPFFSSNHAPFFHPSFHQPTSCSSTGKLSAK